MKNISNLLIFSLLFVILRNVEAQQPAENILISQQEYQQLLKRVELLEKSQALRNEDKSGSDTSTVKQKKQFGTLQIGGYGEAVMHRFFYSDNFNRYTYPDQYRQSQSRGQFDLPHVVFTLSYDFGKGWKVYSEIEYEHGGTGSAIEIEADEFGEYESEIERGGEVVLEQFWLQKSFNSALNIRAGHIIIPIGLTNAHHLPTEYLTVLRPEEESSILPCTWHETGISFWGKKDKWRYEVIFAAGLDADKFNDANWINGGSTSPYEFKIANAYAGAFRVDNYSVKGLRLGISGYYGHSAANSLKYERYKDLMGAVIVGAFDFDYHDHNWWLMGNVDYGHLTDSKAISQINKNLPRNSPSPRTNVASDAFCASFNVGYDFFGLNEKLKDKNMQFLLFGHYGYLNSMFKTAEGILADQRFAKHIISGGVNFYPIKQIVVKIEFQSRFFPHTEYNTENTFSVGICYAGMFSMQNFKNKLEH